MSVIYLQAIVRRSPPGWKPKFLSHRTFFFWTPIIDPVVVKPTGRGRFQNHIRFGCFAHKSCALRLQPCDLFVLQYLRHGFFGFPSLQFSGVHGFQEHAGFVGCRPT